MDVRRRALRPLLPVAVASLFGIGCGSGLSVVENAALEDSTIVAVFNDEPFHISDFERAFERTGNPEQSGADTLETYRDFLERWVDFRLKVLSGRETGYGDDPDINREVHEYRATFARPYLVDKAILTPILRDLYEKRKEMVEASHILIRLDGDAEPEDTLLAYNRTTALRDSIMQGADFGDIAFRHSQDPSARNTAVRQGHRGYLGKFSAGRMVLAFEDAAYSTPVGEVSAPFRSSFGYHLLTVHGREPSVPDVEVAHVLVQVPGSTAEDSANARAVIDGHKKRIDEGMEFAKVAGAFSDDRQSGQYGGGIGRIRWDNTSLDDAFRKAAFALQEPGEVTDIVESAYGFHLIQLIERHEFGTFEEEYDALERMATRLPRMRNAERGLAAEARARYQIVVDTTTLVAVVGDVAPDSVEFALQEAAADDSLAALPVATVGDSVYTVRDLAAFTEKPEHRFLNRPSGSAQALEIANVFISHSAVTQDAMNLERTDPEFAAIMQDFRDGLVLFKLMEDSVWTPATEDSALQQAHFEANRHSYSFPDRRRHIEIYSYSDSLLQDAVARLDSGLAWAEFEAFINRDSVRHVLVDTVLVDGPTNSVHDRALALAQGERTEFLPYRMGNVSILFAGIEPARPKTLPEARVAVTNELQELLEERMLTRLRALYGARTYPDRLRNAFTR